jgi:hypothetical protein
VFGLHAARFHPQGIHRHTDDAVAFARFLSRVPGLIAGEIADLARYEAHWLQFRCGRAWPLLATFHSDPRETAAGRPAWPGKKALIAFWFRIAGRPRHLAIRLPNGLRAEPAFGRASPSRP